MHKFTSLTFNESDMKIEKKIVTIVQRVPFFEIRNAVYNKHLHSMFIIALLYLSFV